MASIVVAPSIEQIFAASNAASAELEILNADLRDRVEQLRSDILSEGIHGRELMDRIREDRRELPEQKEYDALFSEWYQFEKEADATGREAILTFAQSVWEGQAGQGTLVVLSQDDYSRPKDEPWCRLVRVVDFSAGQRFGAELHETGHLELRHARVRLQAERDIDFLSFGRQEYGVFNRSHQGMVKRWVPALVEVALGELTPEELSDLYAKVKAWRRHRMLPAEQLRLFGQIAHFEPGEAYSLGSVSHHSGDAGASLVYLPTGRWGVTVWYDGEEGQQDWIEGVISDPATEVYVSASYVRAEIQGEHVPPTPEEEAFLHSLKGDDEEE